MNKEDFFDIYSGFIKKDVFIEELNKIDKYMYENNIKYELKIMKTSSLFKFNILLNQSIKNKNIRIETKIPINYEYK
jgi:hypothetical protein